MDDWTRKKERPRVPISDSESVEVLRIIEELGIRNLGVRFVIVVVIYHLLYTEPLLHSHLSGLLFSFCWYACMYSSTVLYCSKKVDLESKRVFFYSR